MRESSEKVILKVLHREGDSGLVILNGGEGSGLGGGDRGVAGNNDTEDVTLHGDTEGQRSNVQEDQVLGLVRCLPCEDSSLNGSTVGDSLVRVDGLVQLTATKVLRHQRLDLWYAGGTADENDIVDLFAGDFSILKNALDGVNGRFEHGSIYFLEPSPADVSRKVFTLEQFKDVSETTNSLWEEIGGPGRVNRLRRLFERRWIRSSSHVHKRSGDA